MQTLTFSFLLPKYQDQIVADIERLDLPPLYSTEQMPCDDKLVRIWLKDPKSGWNWFGVEYDPKERIFFGYVEGFENEWGYFSLDELVDCRRVIVDWTFQPLAVRDLLRIRSEQGGQS
jgi:hypothetical protein